MHLFSKPKKQVNKITPKQVFDMLRLYETNGLSGKPNSNRGKLRQSITLYPDRTVESMNITHPPKVSMHGGGAWCDIIINGDSVEYYYTEIVSLASKIPLTQRESDIRIITDAFYDYYNCWRLPDALQENLAKDVVVKELLLHSFDQPEPPLLQIHDNGLMYLIFEGFPPENGKLSDEQCEHFEEILSAFIGVPVIHDDRELFIIEDNSQRTIDLVSDFFEQFK